MTTIVSKWGNSQGIRIPKQVLEDVHLEIGSEANIKYKNGSIVITPIKSKVNYNIKDLVKDINEQAEYDWGVSQGSEIW